jgi:hypothetical protein
MCVDMSFVGTVFFIGFQILELSALSAGLRRVLRMFFLSTIIHRLLLILRCCVLQILVFKTTILLLEQRELI